MHELGIARNIIDLALATLHERCSVAGVTVVEVEVGRLTAVVPESLQFYFDVLKKGTQLEEAQLHIESIPLRTRCTACGLEEAPDLPTLRCSACGNVSVVCQGRELRVVAIETAEPAS